MILRRVPAGQQGDACPVSGSISSATASSGAAGAGLLVRAALEYLGLEAVVELGFLRCFRLALLPDPGGFGP
jgi:hypothetical protein